MLGVRLHCRPRWVRIRAPMASQTPNRVSQEQQSKHLRVRTILAAQDQHTSPANISRLPARTRRAGSLRQLRAAFIARPAASHSGDDIRCSKPSRRQPTSPTRPPSLSHRTRDSEPPFQIKHARRWCKPKPLAKRGRRDQLIKLARETLDPDEICGPRSSTRAA